MTSGAIQYALPFTPPRARGGVVDAFHERLRHAEIREFYPSALLD
jgi:hypothetical protein